VSPACEKAGRPAVNIQTYKDDATVQQAVLSGRSDAFIGGFTTTPYMVSQNSDKFELIGKMPVGADPLGMPFAKGQPELLTAVRAAWEELLRSGEYERIAKKWSLTALVPEEITINNGEQP
jgi:polar amino acid transport system substrate-binding protein